LSNKNLTLKKTTQSTSGVIRTIKPAGSVSSRPYVFDKPSIFNIIPKNDTTNYAINVKVSGFTFNTPSDGSVGIFDAPMMAYSSITNILCNYSKFFFSGIDCWQNTFKDIRSRWSGFHFDIPTGTSNVFERVACDQGILDRNGFRIGTQYTVMNACAADGLNNAYEFINNAVVVLSGCGAESFGRLLTVKDNAVITLNGGGLFLDVVESNKDSYVEPVTARNNSKIIMNGTSIGIQNSSSTPISELKNKENIIASDGAIIILNDSSTLHDKYPDKFKSHGTALNDAVIQVKRKGEDTVLRSKSISNTANDKSRYQLRNRSKQNLFTLKSSDYGTVSTLEITVNFKSAYSSSLAGISGIVKYAGVITNVDKKTAKLVKVFEVLDSTNTSVGASSASISIVFDSLNNAIASLSLTTSGNANTDVLCDVDLDIRSHTVGGSDAMPVIL